MMTLYDSPLSGNCWKVRVLLSQLGLEYRAVQVDVVDHSGRRELMAGKTSIYRVPLLELDDGSCLAESGAILWHLSRGTQYLPDDALEQARVLQWMFFEQNGHEPNLAVARYWLTILGRPAEFEKPLAHRQKRAHEALGVMEERLADSAFFAGDGYTIADIALYPYTRRADEAGISLGDYGNVRSWLARVESQPGFIAFDP
jgi:glutathione S-transferase